METGGGQDEVREGCGEAVGWVAWFSSHPFLKQINVQGQGQGQEARIKDQGSRIGCLVLLPSFSETN